MSEVIHVWFPVIITAAFIAGVIVLGARAALWFAALPFRAVAWMLRKRAEFAEGQRPASIPAWGSAPGKIPSTSVRADSPVHVGDVAR